MHENPWHSRYPNPSHHQWFKNLVEFHRLTVLWTKELHPSPPASGFFILPNDEVLLEPYRWRLEELGEKTLSEILEGDLPEEALIKLQRILWRTQATSLKALYDAASSETQTEASKATFQKTLEETTWKQGVACAQIRWSNLSSTLRRDARDLFLALKDSPYAGFPRGDGFLVKRALSRELEFELRLCPHQHPNAPRKSGKNTAETEALIDLLCTLHSKWIHGFIFQLNPKIKMTHSREDHKCHHRWQLTS